jgi:hypothetical protein
LSSRSLKTIQVVVQSGDLLLETLSLSDIGNNVGDLASGLQRITVHGLPVVEHALREGLSSSVRAQVSSEAERLVYGKVSLDGVKRSSGALLLSEDVSTSSVKNTVDASHGVLGALNLDQVHGLQKTGLSSELSGVHGTTAGGDDLVTTTVNGISVKSHIKDVVSAATHVLLGEDTLLGDPSKGSSTRVLDFVKVLNSLSSVHQKIGSDILRAEAPDTATIVLVDLEVGLKSLGTDLEVVAGGDGSLLNGVSESIWEGLSLHVDAVVLVGRLGEDNLRRLSVDSLTVRDDRVRSVQRDSAELLEILQANLQVKLTGTSDDVLTRLFGDALDARVRLGQAAETLNQLREIGGVLGLDSHTHDGGDAELHDLEVVGNLRSGDSSGLDEVLIDTDKGDGVTAWAVINGLSGSSHHEYGTLDGLDDEIVLLARDVVGAHDSDLLSSADSSREDTSESVEASLVGGGNHLGNVQHKGAVGIAVANGVGALIIVGSLVQGGHTVLLSLNRGRKVEDHHLKKGVGSRQEFAHDGLEENLSGEVTLVGSKVDLKGGDHLLVLGGLSVHDGLEQQVDGVHDELAESTLEGLASGRGGLLGPLLAGGVKEVVSPELLHQLVLGNTELGSVHVSKATESESPAVKTRSEGNGSLMGEHLNITEHLVIVGGDDDVHRLDSSLEGLVSVLSLELELKKSAVHLVNHNDGLDALTEGLTQNGLGLHADTFDAINDDKGTISHTEGGSHLRGEVDVSGGIDQVDQETGVGGSSRDLVLGHLVVEGDTSGLDGNATVLFVLASVGVTGLTSLGSSDDTSLADQGISEGRFAVVDAVKC